MHFGALTVAWNSRRQICDFEVFHPRCVFNPYRTNVENRVSS